MNQKNTTLSQLSEIKVEGYAKVIEVINEEAGLHSIIAIHDLTMGPSLGGTRIYPYASFEEALDDVLRLSKGMTYKSALAEVGFGGGKSVIIADPKKDKNEHLLKAYAAAVHQLEGEYICAEDMGTMPEDMAVIRAVTPYVVGLPGKNSSGNPCPFTAWGTFKGIQATAQQLWRSDSLQGKTVAIQGLGGVGRRLADFLFWHGAKLIVCDVNEEAVRQCEKLYKATVVAPDEIYGVSCDIFVPCARGQILNAKTIPQLKCRAVAGAANNQLADDAAGALLHQRGILYAPDYVINAGGLINVSVELMKQGYDAHFAREGVDRIYETLLHIYEVGAKHNRPTYLVADELGNHRLKHKIGQRSVAPHFHPY